MFTFEIRNTLAAEIADHTERYNFGDVLYRGDEDEIYATATEAEQAGDNCVVGLDGGRAFNHALKFSEVVAVIAEG